MQRNALKNMDWSTTVLYKHFLDCPRQDRFHKHLQKMYEGIYTDVELEYYEKLCLNENKSPIQMEKDALVLSHFNKTVHTLRVVMHLMELDFHFGRIEVKYK